MDVLQNHHELIAPQAGDGVGLAHAGFQAAGDVLQEQIAGGMAEAVVDVLEVVDVDVEQGHAAVFALAAGQGGPEAVVEEATVGQAGEFVVLGGAQQFGLELAAFDGRGDLG